MAQFHGRGRGPPAGGVLRHATAAEPTTFDPHKGASGGDHVSLYPIYDRLLDSDPETLEPLPFLATSWDFTDPQTLTMTLQRGVTFSDGTPFDAEAVVYNVERARTWRTPRSRPTSPSIDIVEATGQYEVTMHLNQPDSSLLGVFADRAGMMVSPTAAEADPEFGQHPVGTGPHTLVEWRPGDTWTYERNEDYWQEGLPYLDGLQFTVQSDGNTKINGLRSGQFDFIDGIEPGRIAELEEVDGLVVSSDPTLLQHMVWWNVDRGPLADVRVRRAINMAIDREAMWEATMEGTGEIAWLPVPSQHWAYSPDLVPTFEYDPEAARALMEEAGYGDGFTISMTSGAGQDAVRRAEIIQAQLAEIGITVEITPEQTVDSVQSYFTDKRMDSFNTSMTSRPGPVDHVPDRVLGGQLLQHGGDLAARLRGAAGGGQGGADAGGAPGGVPCPERSRRRERPVGPAGLSVEHDRAHRPVRRVRAVADRQARLHGCTRPADGWRRRIRSPALAAGPVGAAGGRPPRPAGCPASSSIGTSPWMRAPSRYPLVIVAKYSSSSNG